MRILWVSNAGWCPTGYGTQTSNMIPRLIRDGHKVGLYAIYGLEGAIADKDDVPVFPRGKFPLGKDIHSHANHFRANAIISLFDVWPMDPIEFKSIAFWCPWFPVDHEPLPVIIRDKLQIAHMPITISRFGERMCLEAGIRNVRYIPHSFEKCQFFPENRVESRTLLGIPHNAFLVSMVAANNGYPSRKSFPQCLIAFAEFHKKCPESILYLHTDVNVNGERTGLDLAKLIDSLKLSDSVLFPDQYDIQYDGLSVEHLRRVYCSSDVLLSPSMGEGFGLPILEAQACGTPVITGDWTSMSELTFSGWKIPRNESEPFWSPRMASFQYVPRVGAIREMLEEAFIYRNDTSIRKTAELAANDYDAETIFQVYWKPLLEELQETESTKLL